MFTIIVNGMEIQVDHEKLSYEELLKLAHGGPRFGVYSVTYSRGPNGSSGILLPNREVEVTTGMVFNACHTSNA